MSTKPRYRLSGTIPSPWPEADRIVAGIRGPVIPKREFVLHCHGSDLGVDICQALRETIASCATAGGGRVVVPAGIHQCRGPIQLLSNVGLHLSAGSYLKFSTDPQDYLPQVYCRWEGVNLYNYSPPIYANGASDIAITGKGVIDGGAEVWSTYREKQQESRMEAWRVGAEAVPLEERRFGEKHYLRPSMLQLMNCERVLIEGVTLVNSPFWMIHPAYCKHVTIRGTTCHSMFINNDGVDIDSCSDVLIEDASFSSGDDGIAMKAGRDRDAWETGIPTRNVVVRNCRIPEALHGFAVGSEMSSGVENVYVYNCSIGRIASEAIQFKSNRDRGGFMRNIHLYGITVEEAGDHFIYFTNDYHSFQGGNAPTAFSNISISDVSCEQAENAIHIQGLEAEPIHRVSLRNINVHSAKEALSCKESCHDVSFENVRVNDVSHDHESV